MVPSISFSGRECRHADKIFAFPARTELSVTTGSPVVSHAAVDESAPDENERVIRLAARPMEDPSPGSNRSLRRSVHRVTNLWFAKRSQFFLVLVDRTSNAAG